MPLVPKSPIPPLPKPVFEAAFGLASKSPWLADHDQGLVELIHLCPTSGCVDLVSSLLGRFRYFFVDAALRETKAAVRFCAEYWQLDAKCCYFVTISDPGRANSGQTILNWMKNELGGDPNWTKNNFVTIGRAAHAVPSGGTIVLVDDFIGSATSLSSKVAFLRKVLANRAVTDVRILTIALAVMESAASVVNSLVDDSYIVERLRRGISDYWTGASLTQATSDMAALEALLAPKIKGIKLPQFGYKRSESLYAIQDTSVPNNVFPIFWWPLLATLNARKTLLNRAL